MHLEKIVNIAVKNHNNSNEAAYIQFLSHEIHPNERFLKQTNGKISNKFCFVLVLTTFLFDCVSWHPKSVEKKEWKRMSRDIIKLTLQL